jgi:branched-chain amino acid aminotransferase
MEVAEAPIDIEDVVAASRAGTLEEMWGVGTAAVISPVGELAWRGEKIVVNGGQTGPVAAKLFEHLTGLHAGTVPDRHGWSVAVD